MSMQAYTSVSESSVTSISGEAVAIEGGVGERPAGMPVRLTAFGMLTIATSLVLGSTLFIQKQPLAATLGIGLLVATALSALVVQRRLRRVSARWVVPPNIRALADTTLGASIEANGGCSPFTLLAWQPANERFDEIANLPGAGPAATRLAWVQRFPRRGLVQLPGLQVRGQQPFGLVEGRALVGPGIELLVLPMVGRVRQHLLTRLQQRLEGGSTSNASGDDDLARVRNYRPGDLRRRIHWRATARARRLMVAERSASALRKLAIVLDLSQVRVPTSSRARTAAQVRVEKLVGIAATLVEHLAAEGWLLSLHGHVGSLARGVVGSPAMLLRELALARTHEAVEPASLLPQGQTCLLLSLREEQLDSNALSAAMIGGGRAVGLNLGQALRLVRLPTVRSSES